MIKLANDTVRPYSRVDTSPRNAPEENEESPNRLKRQVSKIKDPSERANFKDLPNQRVPRVLKRKASIEDEELGPTNNLAPTLTMTTMVLLFGLSAVFDLSDFLLNLIPYVGGILADILVVLPGTFTLWFMYRRKGIDMKSNKVMFRFFATTAMSFIPVINALPDFLLKTFLIVGAAKAKDIL